MTQPERVRTRRRGCLCCLSRVKERPSPARSQAESQPSYPIKSPHPIPTHPPVSLTRRYNMMRVLGNRLTYHSPSRGFS